MNLEQFKKLNQKDAYDLAYKLLDDTSPKTVIQEEMLDNASDMDIFSMMSSDRGGYYYPDHTPKSIRLYPKRNFKENKSIFLPYIDFIFHLSIDAINSINYMRIYSMDDSNNRINQEIEFDMSGKASRYWSTKNDLSDSIDGQPSEIRCNFYDKTYEVSFSKKEQLHNEVGPAHIMIKNDQVIQEAYYKEGFFFGYNYKAYTAEQVNLHYQNYLILG